MEDLKSSGRELSKVVKELNSKDDGVPSYQSLQYFRLLRRLGKKVFMLDMKKAILA
jgi:hypothetical protein